MPAISSDPRHHFDRGRAARYDERIREIFPGYEALHRGAAFLLARLVPEQGRILVCGAGTGQELAALGGLRHSWRLVAFDPSPAMLELAARKVEKAGIADRVTLTRGTIERIDPEDRFDGAVSILVGQLFADNGAKAGYLRQIGARLRPGAPLIIADIEGRRGTGAFDVFFSAWREQQYTDRPDAKEVDKDIAHVETRFHPVDEGRLRRLLAAAGFDRIDRFFQMLVFGGFVAFKKG